MQHHRSIALRATAAVMALLLPACYTSQPLATPVPAAETHIVAELTDRGTADMDRWLGPRAERVDAIVASADSVTWQLKLLKVSHRNGAFQPWNGDVVPFAATAFDTVVVRRLDKRRSWLTAAGVVAGAVLLARLFHVVGVGESGDGPPPPPPQ